MKYDFLSIKMYDFRRFLLFAYAFLLPFTDWLSVKLNGIIIILLSALWLYDCCFIKQQKKKFVWNDFFILTGVFLIQLLSLLQGGATENILSSILIKLPFLLFPIFFLRSKFGDRDLYLIKLFFFAGCFLSVLLSATFILLDHLNGIISIGNHNYESYLMLHRPYYGIYLLTSVVLLMNEKRIRFLLISAGLFFILFLWFIQAKMACVILLVLLFIRLISFMQIRFRRLIVISGMILCSIVFVWLLNYYFTNRGNADHLTPKMRFFILSINTRLIHWDCGWRILGEHFVLGTGGGNIKNTLNACYQSNHAAVYRYVKDYNIHNEFLEESVRHGFVGFLIYILCFFCFLKMAIKSADRNYLFFLIIVILASITETTFSREQGVLMIAFFNTILYLNNAHINQEEDNVSQINTLSASASIGSK